MSKELKALETLKDMLIGNGVNDNINEYVDNLILPIKQALIELKTIKEANPSEALECLEEIKSQSPVCHYDDGSKSYVFEKEFDTIKQALLKAQYHNSTNIFKGSKKVKIEIPESGLMDYNPVKQYLKWDDLEFTKDLKCQKVKMNDNDYRIRYTLDDFGGKCCFLYDSARNHYIVLNKQFFNDLHLERVE